MAKSNGLKPLATQTLTANSLRPDDLTLATDDRAVFYDVHGDNFKISEFIDSSNKWAGGGFVASPTDLASLGGAWLEGAFISADTREVFWTPQKPKQNHQYAALARGLTRRRQ